MLGLTIVNCQSRVKTPQAYCAYIEDNENGLKVTEEKNGIIFTLQYKPAIYMAIKENNVSFKRLSELKKAAAAFEDLQHFNLSISDNKKGEDVVKKGTSTQEQFQERIAYLSYPAQKDIFLIEGNDTLACVLYHFERSYNLSPYNNLVLGFENKSNEENENREIIYNDKIWNLGQVKLTIRKEAIHNIRQIDLPE